MTTSNTADALPTAALPQPSTRRRRTRRNARRLRLDEQIAEENGLRSQTELDFAKERFDWVVARLERSGVNIFRNFVNQKSP